MKERVDDLQYEGLKLIQAPGAFCFGLDAVLLADFADVKRSDRVLDIGTGTGIVAILVSAKKGAAHVTGLEIQPEMADMAARSVALNGLEPKIGIVCGDVRKARGLFGAGSFDAVVANPPYMKHRHGLVNQSDALAVSRHEILCALDDVIDAAAFVLKDKGRLTMVHRPERLVDIVASMRRYGIEPKCLRFVHPSAGKKPNLILIRGLKNGRPDLKMTEPLYVYDENGCYTGEIDRIYGRERTL